MAAQTVTKVQYENNVTVIGAENLNAIQDAVNNHASLIDDLDNDKVDKVAGKGLSTNDFNNDAQSKLNNLPTGEQLDTSLGQKVSKRTSGTEVYTHNGSTQGGATLTETPTAGAVPLYGTDGVLKASAPVADNDVVRKAELDDVKDNLDAAFVTNTASGAIASFADGADNVPMRKLVASIDPVQDLHGYDHPWPAGGGKNLLFAGAVNETRNGITFTAIGDGSSFRVNGTAQANTALIIATGAKAPEKLKSGVTYTISGGHWNGTDVAYIQLVYKGDTSGNTISLVSSAGPTTYTAPEDATLSGIYISFMAGNTFSNDLVQPQFEIGSTATAFAPYSNICPITGWTGMTGKRTGKNLYDATSFVTSTINGITLTNNGDGTFTATGTASDTASFFLPMFTSISGTEYYINGCPENGSSTKWKLDINVGGSYIITYGGAETGTGFTGDGNKNSVRIIIYPGSGSNINLVFKPMIYLRSNTSYSFAPYTGTDITADWSSVAGTVYGGTLTINPDRTGTLVVDRVAADLGDTAWVVATSGYYLTSGGMPLIDLSIIVRPGTAQTLPNIICSMYAQSNALGIINGSNDNSIGISSSSGAFMLRDDSVSSADELKAKVTGQKVVAYITPQTYQLTESQITGILTTLLGNNNVWADCGDTEVTYCADTKLYIQQLTQPTEDDMTADHAISAGTFFQLGNTLYLATAQIAAGGTITPGTNATKLSIADALNQVNA